MRHFYHLWCGPQWEHVAGPHQAALEASGAAWELTVGILGPEPERARARALFPGADFAEADAGWEQHTLRRLHEWAKQAGPDEPVLYAHSKGVGKEGGPWELIEKIWRESMTDRLVTGWREAVALLQDHDAVGCHWLEPGGDSRVDRQMFAGNFWWSKAGYLARLPPVSDATRFEAEGWIALGSPRVADLRPGRPSFVLFAREAVAALNPGLEL